jgi:hypothetical protein
MMDMIDYLSQRSLLADNLGCFHFILVVQRRYYAKIILALLLLMFLVSRIGGFCYLGIPQKCQG